MSQPIAAGEVFAVRYPFIRVQKDLLDGDVDDEGRMRAYSYRVTCWAPGTRMVEPADQYSDPEFVADGVGSQLLTIVSVHRPPGFPERVFFTQTWMDPDGRTFGKRRLHIFTTDQFRRRARGYLHPFTVTQPEKEPA